MARPTLIVYCGLPGVGKSVASGYTAEHLSAERYRSDEIRKRLFPDPAYTDEETNETYEEMFRRARPTLESGTNVVLDATFRSERYRDRAAALASETGANLEFARVRCDVAVVKKRLENRTESVSDAGFREYRLVKDSFEPIERDHVVIDNSATLEETYRQIDRSVLRACRP